jgi:hypothetical protein
MMEAPGNPQQQAVGTARAPPTPGIPSDHDGGPVTPRHSTADDPIMSRPPKRRLLLEAATEATATGTLLELKETLIEQARDELHSAMQSMKQSMTRYMEAAFKEYRQAEEERWERERKKMGEFWKAESRKMLEVMQEGTAAGTQARRTGGGPEVMEATDPTALAEGSDEMEITPTGRRTQLEFSKHAVNVHDRHDRDKTPAVQRKNISKHALADLGKVDGRLSTTPKASRPAEAPKATQPTEIPKDAAPPASQAQPIPGLGAIRSPTRTYAGALNSYAPRQSESEWKKIGSKGKVQKESSDDWPGLRPLKPRNNPEDDRKIIFPRDGRTPHARHPMAITSEVNRALRRAGVADHIRVLSIKRNMKGILSGLVRADSNAQQLLHFKDLVLKAAREADSGIVGVESNETWAKVKIHGVSLERYMTETGPEGLQILREEIEAENPGVVIPTAPHWVGSVNRIMERWGQGEIRGSTVIFAIQDKRIAERLLATGLRAAGLCYKVERYAIEGPDAICANCSGWGHIAEKCDAPARCMYCAEDHPASQHHCLIPTCTEPKGPGHLCKYNKEKCANCGGKHVAQSGKCADKQRAILAARDQRNKANLTTGPPSPRARASPAAEPQLASNTEASHDDSDDDRIMATADEPQL